MLDAVACETDYRAALLAAYGRLECAEGTAHAPEAWFATLRNATALESHTVEQMVALSAFAFVERVCVRTSEAEAALDDAARSRVLGLCRESMSEQDLCSPEAAKAFFQRLRHALREADGLRGRQVMSIIRAALTGSMVGPCLGIVASLLGHERMLRRLEEWL
jgi:glutamyl/glutaminyl-tRNA synthetase